VRKWDGFLLHGKVGHHWAALGRQANSASRVYYYCALLQSGSQVVDRGSRGMTRHRT
jgi:hypothetical protein